MYARAPQKVDKQGLNAVLAVVSHTDDVQIEVVQKPHEVGIAQVARRHFDADLVQFSIRAGVEMHQMQWNVKAGAKVAHEEFVPVRLLAAQMEVAVSRLCAVAQPFQHQQQRHTVGSAAQCHETTALLAEHIVTADIFRNSLFHHANHSSKMRNPWLFMLPPHGFRPISYSTYSTSPLRYSPSGW